MGTKENNEVSIRGDNEGGTGRDDRASTEKNNKPDIRRLVNKPGIGRRDNKLGIGGQDDKLSTRG